MRRVARHAAALRPLVSNRGDVLLLVRMLGWWISLPVLKRLVPLPRLVRLARLGPKTSERDPEREAKVGSLAEWLFRSRPRNARDNCLERSLVAYRFLGRLNARPELIVGVGARDGTVVGHVWVTVDGRPVHDALASLDGYDSIVVFGPDGHAAPDTTAASAR